MGTPATFSTPLLIFTGVSSKYPLAYMMDPRPIIVDIDINDLGVQAARFLLERLKNTSVHIQTHSTVSAIIDNEM